MTYSEFRNQFSNTWSFMHAYGSLSFEEVKALIDAEMCPPSEKTDMFDAWRDARRNVKLRTIGVFYSDSRELEIIFYEYDSEFNGNDFEYRYSLDADNADAFLNIIPHQWADPKTNIQEWLIENVDCRGRGMDLQKKWIEMGLHGTWVDWEDYPGGIHHKGAF